MTFGCWGIIVGYLGNEANVVYLNVFKHEFLFIYNAIQVATTLKMRKIYGKKKVHVTLI